MNEFEEKMSALNAALNDESRSFTRQVLGLELQHRFGDKSQLPEEFASRALKAVKARPGAETSE